MHFTIRQLVRTLLVPTDLSGRIVSFAPQPISIDRREACLAQVEAALIFHCRAQTVGVHNEMHQVMAK